MCLTKLTQFHSARRHAGHPISAVLDHPSLLHVQGSSVSPETSNSTRTTSRNAASSNFGRWAGLCSGLNAPSKRPGLVSLLSRRMVGARSRCRQARLPSCEPDGGSNLSSASLSAEARCRCTGIQQSGWIGQVAGQPFAGLAAGLPVARPADGDVPCPAAHACQRADRQGIKRGADFPAGRPWLTTITLRIDAHLFNTVDSTAAAAIESVLRKPADRWSGCFVDDRGQFLVCSRGVAC